jgi:DNA-binding winged helix-turn-helix (wHTH) protein/Tol biopolymer transport system component
MPDRAIRVISFADFRLDLRAGELRRNGTKVKLQNQPFQVLAMLLEQPGEIVGRDELRARLWPAETFVDFDHGLNSAVRRLRDALGDSADKPTFIETVERRGYRFVFPVEPDGLNSDDGGKYLAAVVPISSTPSTPVGSFRVPRPSGWRRRSLRITIAGGLLAIAGAWLLMREQVAATRVAQWLRRGVSVALPAVVQRQLTANPQDVPVISAALSPDGKYLAYTDKTGFYVQQISTGETHPVDLGTGFHPLVQSWFPDSTHIAVSHIGVDGKASGIWVVSMLGGSPRQLTDNGAAPRISRDGRQIFFLRSAIGRNETWLMQADGDHQRRVLSDSTADQVYFSAMAWAPNGRRAAFIRTVLPVYNAADPTGPKRTLEVLDMASGDVEVAVASQELESAFGWADDDSVIYALREPSPNQNDFGLWRMRVARDTARPLDAPLRIATGYGRAADLSVTSDGKLAALRRTEPNDDVYIAELDAHTMRLSPKRLTLNDRADYAFGWTGDSRAVLFLSDRDGPIHLYRQALNQTLPELLLGGDEILAIPRISPSGTDVFYLQMPNHGDTSDNVKIMRVPLAGGVPQRIVEARGIWNYQCAQLPATLCIYSPTDANVQRFFAFDTNTGESHEIPSAQVSADPARPNWSLAPDGCCLATQVLRANGDAAIRVLSLSDGSQKLIPLPGWPSTIGHDWASDGKSLWVAATSSRANGPRDCALLNVGKTGAIRVMFQDDGICFLAGIPSPDGRHLALEGMRPESSNVWLLENVF